jgi:hypothetical protein
MSDENFWEKRIMSLKISNLAGFPLKGGNNLFGIIWLFYISGTKLLTCKIY